MGWLDTIGGWLDTGAGIAQDVGQIAQPFLSWYGYEQNKDAIDSYQQSLQQGAQQGQQALTDTWHKARQDVLPYVRTGEEAMGKALDWTLDPNKYAESPGVDWAREQGMQGIERSAAARGGLESGRTLKELSRYNQGLALQDYHNQISNLTNLGAVGAGPAQALMGRQQDYGQDLASLGMYGSAAGGVGDLAGNQNQMDFLYDLLGISQGQGQPGGGLAQNVGSLGSLAKGTSSLGAKLGLWGGGAGAVPLAGGGSATVGGAGSAGALAQGGGAMNFGGAGGLGALGAGGAGASLLGGGTATATGAGMAGAHGAGSATMAFGGGAGGAGGAGGMAGGGLGAWAAGPWGGVFLPAAMFGAMYAGVRALKGETSLDKRRKDMQRMAEVESALGQAGISTTAGLGLGGGLQAGGFKPGSKEWQLAEEFLELQNKTSGVNNYLTPGGNVYPVGVQPIAAMEGPSRGIHRPETPEGLAESAYGMSQASPSGALWNKSMAQWEEKGRQGAPIPAQGSPEWDAMMAQGKTMYDKEESYTQAISDIQDLEHWLKENESRSSGHKYAAKQKELEEALALRSSLESELNTLRNIQPRDPVRSIA